MRPAALITLVCSFACATARPPLEPPRPRVLDLHDIEVSDAARLFSQWGDLVFMAPADLHGRLTIVSDSEVAPDEIGLVFAAALGGRGVRGEPSGLAVHLVRDEKIPWNADLETHVLHIANAGEAATALREATGPEVYAIAVTSSLLTITADRTRFSRGVILGQVLSLAQRWRPAPPPVSAHFEPITGVRRVTDSHYEVATSTLERLLANLNELASQARIVPAFRDGQAYGFKVFSIRPGSFYEAAGFQNGDVVIRINGIDITSPDHALEAYEKLRGTRAIVVEFERGGQMMRTEYAITQ